MRNLTFTPAVLSLLLTAACGSSETGSSHKQLCPACTPWAGGETSDFGGGTENCRESEAPLDEDTATELKLATALATASEPLRAPLRWYQQEQLLGEGELVAQVELGTPVYYASGVAVSNACRDTIRVPAQVEIQTEIGGIEATLEGELRLRRGDLSWQLHASKDLGSVNGSQELELDVTRPHRGRLVFAMSGFGSERRGTIAPQVIYLDEVPSGYSDDEALAFAFSPWYAQYPVDGCAARAFPAGLDEPHSFFGVRSPREVIIGAFEDVSPETVAARYHDGTTTDVSTQLGEPNGTEVCIEDQFGVAVIHFPGSARVTSSDARVGLDLERFSLSVAGGSGAPQRLLLSRRFEAQSPAELEVSMGFGGIDGASHEVLAGSVRVDLEWTPEGFASYGSLLVFEPVGGHPVDCLLWPVGDTPNGCAAERF